MLREIPGWFIAGSHPRNYEHGLADEKLEAKNVGYIRCIVEEPVGFGTVMQMIDAEEYRAKRIRLSCWARPSNVSRWAGMWLRVDESTGKQSAFDNMQQRPMKGTGDWARHETVLDVGPESAAIAFGILLDGPGEVHFADFSLEEVSEDVPVTAKWPSRPQNLDFSA